jgi:NAD(P)-dependent dehydrogenase (short-subunit alcohol dehydrogenase family)
MSTKTCVITGASRGIGLATALRFARLGCRIVAAARNAERLGQAAVQIRAAGGECEPVVVDVSIPEEAERLIQRTVERFGRVDVLVNNAGFAVLKPVDQTELAELERSLAVNVRAVFCTTRAAWAVMKRQGGGVIVNVSSAASVDPFSGFSVYGACKAWVNLFTQATADEGRKLGIRVLAIAPGAVETEMLRSLFPDLPADQTLDPAIVAAVIEALCDERLAYAAGQTIFLRK